MLTDTLQFSIYSLLSLSLYIYIYIHDTIIIDYYDYYGGDYYYYGGDYYYYYSLWW